jgi:hypothetical protein
VKRAKGPQKTGQLIFNHKRKKMTVIIIIIIMYIKVWGSAIFLMVLKSSITTKKVGKTVKYHC